MRPTAALLVVVVVASALPGGALAAPTDRATNPASPTSTASTDPVPTVDRSVREAADEYNVTVVGGELPFDPNVTYARVEQLLGRDAPEPPTIVITSSDDGDDADAEEPNRFRRLLGFETESEFEVHSQELGDGVLSRTNASSGWEIYINEDHVEEPTLAEPIVAHEFVHLYQREIGGMIPDDESVDGAMAHTAAMEGVADHIEHVYWARYVNDGTDPNALNERRYTNGDLAERMIQASYFYGSTYVAAMTDEPENAMDVFTNAPRTTEHVLHDVEPGTEPLVPLTVESGSGDWTERNRTRMGEMFLRIALSGELNRSEAARGADGWGNDRRIEYENDAGAAGFVWVLRWDDAANASEFEGVFERYLDRRATRSGDRWKSDAGTYRLRRVDDLTTVVVLGNRSFVTGTTITANGDAVTVDVPGETTPTATPTDSPSPTETDRSTGTVTTDDANDVETPGFGPVAGLAAIGGAAHVLARRRR